MSQPNKTYLPARFAIIRIWADSKHPKWGLRISAVWRSRRKTAGTNFDFTQAEISIQDIGRIFRASGSEIVLDVLGKKVGDIDEEISLLHELKEIVLDFIRQIEKADFGKDSDVKLLYEKAKEIKTQLVNVDYNGNPAAVNFRSASSPFRIR